MIIYKIKWKSYRADLYLPEKSKNKIVILVPGLPKSSNVDKIIKEFISSGCLVLYPNFSGTFDSGGTFDPLQSIKDVQEFIECARQSQLTELYFDKKIELGSDKEIILVGMSFGAIISLLACNNKVDKLILLSPALLFNQDEINKIINFYFKSQMDHLISFLKKAFPYTYRVRSLNSLKQFLHGKMSILHKKNIEDLLNKLKTKTLILHGKLDSSVPWQISNELKKSTNNSFIEWRFFKIGHSTSSYNRSSLNKISDFIKK